MDESPGGFKDLIVWQKSMLLVKQIYLATKIFPNDEKFGLCSQMRRAAVSIPSNIAEGQARKSTKEFIHFLSIAQGSLAELETQLIIANELCYVNVEIEDPGFGLIVEIRKMLNSLRRKLESRE